MEPGRAGAGRAQVAGVLLAVALLAAAVYSRSLGGHFVYDDALLVAGNPDIRSLPRAAASFGRGYWEGLKDVAPYYRPLVTLTFAGDYAVGGLRPVVFHAKNLLLHAGSAVLVALLVLTLGPRRRPEVFPFDPPGPGRALLAGAAFAGALAAAHPIHSEAVAAIYGRPDLLAAFLALAFLNLAARGHGIAATACLAGALLSKESAIGLPLLVPSAFAAGRRWRARRMPPGVPPARRGPGRLPGVLAAAGLLGGYALLRLTALGRWYDPAAVVRLDNPLVVEEGIVRWLSPVALVARYAGLWLRPVRLCADRGYDAVPLASGPFDPAFLLGAALLSLVLFALLHLAIRRSPWALPLGAALLAWLPASNLVVLAPALMAERFLYLPSLMVCAIAGGAAARLVSGLGRPGGAAGWPYGAAGLALAAAVPIALGAGATFVRIADFHDDLTLHASTAANCPRSVKAQYNLGNALARAGRDEEALGAYERATALAPWMAVAHANRGNVLLGLRRLEEAEAAYRRAIEADARLLNPHASLAGVLFLDGRLEEALEEVHVALSLGPEPADAAQLIELGRRIEARLVPGASRSR